MVTALLFVNMHKQLMCSIVCIHAKMGIVKTQLNTTSEVLLLQQCNDTTQRKLQNNLYVGLSSHKN